VATSDCKTFFLSLNRLFKTLFKNADSSSSETSESLNHSFKLNSSC